MKRGNRLASPGRFARAIMVLAACAAAAGTAGCGSLLGIDDGTPFPDGDVVPGDDGNSGDFDVYVANDGTTETGVDAAGEAGDTATGGDDVTLQDSREETAPAGDATDAPRADAPAEACTPNFTFCQNRCKPGTDSCGIYWMCSGTCAPGEGCALDGQCICSPDPHWCDNRCGPTTDNCGNMITCPNCAGGQTCTNGACGCVAESNQMACGSNQCNSVKNNCMQTINCGVNGTTGCAAGQECTSSNTCCTLATCAGRCNTMISDNCGGMLSCPANGCPGGDVCYQTNCCMPVNNCGSQCGISVSDNCGGSIACTCSSGVCYQGSCCTPNGTCNGNCIDNCGQQSQACCDAGGPPFDGGMPPCVPQGSMCMGAPYPCCAPYTCRSGIVPLIERFFRWFGVTGDGLPGPDGGMLPDAGLPPPICQ
jgi:hypothetical protein